MDKRPLLPRLLRFARKPLGEQACLARDKFLYPLVNVGVPRWRVPRRGNDRTLYVIGLFGTGRWYINELLRYNTGVRGSYLRDMIRFHPGPTSMIYSGHATIRHVSSLQDPPATTSLLLQAVESGFADSIFIYRHPLDSLLTNWVWWRTYIRSGRLVRGISQVYGSTDDLCADLDRNFSEFRVFADGDPGFFARAPGLRFLSFSEFIEETELHLPTAGLALRLEDFMFDPSRQFSRIAGFMSIEFNPSRVNISRPRSTPYRYRVVKEKVPQFRAFVDGLNAGAKKRMERIGYGVDG